MNVFDLVATLSLNKDGYDSGLSSAESAASKFGNSVGNVMGVAAKATVAAVGAAATAVGALVKEAVESYANYEQLVGGVETLFGAQGMSLSEYAKSVGDTVANVKSEYESLLAAQETVLGNAANAYKTAGLSANEYMETVTSFAAALTTSLDGNTQAAAEKADMAITDMSDNANKMGTSMEAIQNAYNGFAKQNYTMLDNLKLGFGGTKEEMQRLLDKASEISKVKYDISSYADIVDAIHVVQSEMGITGTTAKEAESTISGSLNMVKSAWANLITGIADDDANFSQLIGNMVESVSAFGSNIIPRIEIALNGVGELINEMMPVVLDEIPTLINDMLPKLLESGVSMVTSILEGIQSNSGSLVETAMNIIMTLVDAIIENVPVIIETGLTLITSLVSGITEQIPTLVEAAFQIVESLMSAIGEALPVLAQSGIDIIFQLITGITENLPQLFAQAAEIIYQLAAGIQENLPTIIEQALIIIQDFATTLAENVPVILEAGFALLEALVEGLIEALPVLIEMLPTIITTFANVINDNMPKIILEGVQLIVKLVEGIIQAIPVILENMPKIVEAIVSVIEAMNWIDLGSSIIKGLGNGIKNMLSFAKECITSINTGITELLAAMPSKIFAIGKKFISEGLVGGLKSMLNTLLTYIGSLMAMAVKKFASFSLREVGQNLIKGLWNGISDMAQWVYNQISSFGAGVVQAVKDIFGVASPSKVFAEIGGYLAEGLGNGWNDEYDSVKKSITSDLDFAATPIEVSGSATGTSTAGGNVINQTINVNREVATADELAKAIRIESRYGLMKGVALG